MRGKFLNIPVWWSLVVVLALLLLPPGALAADKPAVTLEQAIKTVKDNFEVPGDATGFTSGFDSFEGRQSWSLNWNNPNGSGSSMNAEVDAVTGDILNINFWKHTPLGTQAVLDPKQVVSREDALAVAEELINRLEPDKIKNLQLVQDSMLMTDFENYNFHWQRLVEGISFPQDGITITVSTQDKRVTNYQFQWTRADFPKAAGVISTAQAEQSFRSAGMLELQYTEVSDDTVRPMQKMGTKPKVILVYRLQDPSGGTIDAFTGKSVNLQEGVRWLGSFMGGGGIIANGSVELKLPSGMGMSQLSPKELQETQETDKLINREQAIAEVRKWVNIPENLTLTSANQSLDGRYSDIRVWNLNWGGSNTEKQAVGELQYVWARVDAVTGELLGFNLEQKHNSQQVGSMDRKSAQKLAEDFLRKVQPQRFAETRLDENSNPPVYDMAVKNPPYQDFTFQRIVNGITFPANNLNVNVDVDAVNGRITSYNLTWAQLEFPLSSQAIPVAKGEDAFLSYRPLNLTYVQTQTQEGSGEIRLVYLPLAPTGTPVSDIISAVSGEPLNWQGKPISNLPRSYRFTDIQGNFAAKEISLLGQRGIFGEYGDTFHPDEKVTTVSLLRAMLLASGREYAGVSDKEILDRAKKLGWLGQGEQWQSVGTVSRENMAKLLVRFLDLDRVARLKGIYQVAFNDAADISPDSLGYVALARGLQIIKGDGSDFRPADPVTRAQAAVALVRSIEAKQ